MTTIVPYCNPLRFKKIGEQPVNYIDILPQRDIIEPRQEYQKGIYATPNLYPCFDVNHTLSLLIYLDIEPFNAIMVQKGATILGTITDITPANFQNTSIFKINFNNLRQGFWSINVIGESSDYNTHEFYVANWASTKNLVKLNFYDSENRGGVFFDSNDNQIWNPIAFYNGNIQRDEPEFEITEYTRETGNSENLNVTPQLRALLTITELHVSYLDNLAYQLRCDNLYINNDSYNFVGMKVEQTDKQDVVDVTINLVYNENNEFQQI